MMQLQDGLFAGNALYYLAALALVLLVSGGVGFLAQRDRPAARMRGLAVRHGGPGGPSLAKIAEETPRGLARALIPEPKLIVADEPVSMVDASLRMSIVNLFRDLRDRLGVSIIYITHDLSTAYYISDRVIIMHKGDVVEAGVAQEVLGNPQHAYSKALSQAVLPPDPVAARKIIMAKIT